MIIGICSGYFSPLHIGHIRYLEEAKRNCDILLVIVNNNQQQIEKKGSIIQDEEERKEIVNALYFVDKVYIATDIDNTVCKSIEDVYKLNNNGDKFIFFKGGDRGLNNTPELKTCKRLGISVMFGVGGNYKLNSSTNILRKMAGAK